MSRRYFPVIFGDRDIHVEPEPRNRSLQRLVAHAEIWGAALAVGGAAYGANQQRRAAGDAAAGMDAASQVQWDMYQQQRTDQMPWLEAGQRNLAQLQDLNRGDFSSFVESPDYQFARDQGIQGLDRSAASRGTQYSGGQLAALADFSGGLASQNYGTYYNRIANLAGVGQTAANQVGQAAGQYGANAGNLAVAQGENAANARYGTASTYRDLGEQLGGAFGRWYRGSGSGSGSYTPAGGWENYPGG